MMGAGTDANVYITVYGQLENGEIRKSSKITLDNKDNNFESGKCDEFPIKTFNFTKVTKVIIGHDNSGMSAAWHLNKVCVCVCVCMCVCVCERTCVGWNVCLLLMIYNMNFL